MLQVNHTQLKVCKGAVSLDNMHPFVAWWRGNSSQLHHAMLMQLQIERLYSGCLDPIPKGMHSMKGHQPQSSAACSVTGGAMAWEWQMSGLKPQVQQAAAELAVAEPSRYSCAADFQNGLPPHVIYENMSP